MVLEHTGPWRDGTSASTAGFLEAPLVLVLPELVQLYFDSVSHLIILLVHKLLLK